MRTSPNINMYIFIKARHWLCYWRRTLESRSLYVSRFELSYRPTASHVDGAICTSLYISPIILAWDHIYVLYRPTPTQCQDNGTKLHFALIYRSWWIHGMVPFGVNAWTSVFPIDSGLATHDSSKVVFIESFDTIMEISLHSHSKMCFSHCNMSQNNLIVEPSFV